MYAALCSPPPQNTTLVPVVHISGLYLVLWHTNTGRILTEVQENGKKPTIQTTILI